MKYADIIIPHGRSNTIAIDFVISNLKMKIPMGKVLDNISAEKSRSAAKTNKVESKLNIGEKVTTFNDKIVDDQLIGVLNLSETHQAQVSHMLSDINGIMKDIYISQIIKMLSGN